VSYDDDFYDDDAGVCEHDGEECDPDICECPCEVCAW